MTSPPRQPTPSEAHDLLVVGAGAAGLTCAIVAAAEGQRVLLVDGAATVGGTSAISGGMVWVPANHLMAAAGIADDLDKARLYLDNTLPPSADVELREAFLTHGDEAVRFLEARTSAVRMRPVRTYPDYYPDLPGATAGGRVLEPIPFDGRNLGRSFAQLRPPLPELTLFGGMMISREDIPHLRRFARSPRSAARVARLLARHAYQRARAPRGTSLHLGNALVARLFRSALDLGVEIRLQTAVTSLLTDGSRVAGAELSTGDGESRSSAAGGVVLATGGVSHDPELRRPHVPAGAGDLSAAVGTGELPSGARLAIEAGAQYSRAEGNGAFWVPCSSFTKPDGSEGLYPHIVTDRAKPGLIAVGADGRRFVNEAVSYHEFGLAQLRAGARAMPAYLVVDRRFLWKYGLGRVRPFTLRPGREVASGYLTRARTVPALADALGIPAETFVATVENFNADARQGLDREFGRGANIYQRHLGDAEHKPNPCVAPIERAPFYAVPVRPADLGMSAGLLTDPSGRVLGVDGSRIPGLYACGNDMDSLMAGAYPGPGITLGPALTFAFLAARAALADTAPMP